MIAPPERWPKSCSREEWFRITRDIVAGVMADMALDLNDEEFSLVEQHFINGSKRSRLMGTCRTQ